MRTHTVPSRLTRFLLYWSSTLTVVSADTRPLTWRLQHGDAITDIKTYESLEGYAAVRKVVKEMSPLDVQKVVKDANLRGRGGAGFPTGVKWSLIPMGADAGVKYLVCNADEMEPGTFKDRLLMEKLPHQLVESMIVAGYAIQATRAYIFLRGEYILAAERLNDAIKEAKAAGYLGENILGSGWSMFICSSVILPPQYYVLMPL